MVFWFEGFTIEGAQIIETLDNKERIINAFVDLGHNQRGRAVGNNPYDAFFSALKAAKGQEEDDTLQPNYPNPKDLLTESVIDFVVKDFVAQMSEASKI